MRRKIGLCIVLAVFAVTCVEGVSHLTLWLVPKWRGPQAVYWPMLPDSLRTFHRDRIEKTLNDETEYYRFDPILGWSIKKNGRSGYYRANADGFRSETDYGTKPSADIIRISSFGDSFTHGHGVRPEATWQKRMELSYDKMEVLNFGVNGYGLGQAYLRYEQLGEKYHPHIVLIGYMSDDISRDVNSFPPFYVPHAGEPLSRPHFAVEEGRLVVHKNPIETSEGYRRLLARPDSVLPQIGLRDYYYNLSSFNLMPTYYRAGPMDFLASVRLVKMTWFKVKGRTFGRHWPLLRHLITMYNPRNEPFAVAKKIMETFYQAVLADNAIPFIVVFPDHPSIEVYRETSHITYEPLLNFMEENNFNYVDIMAAFAERDGVPLTNLFNGSHYSSLGHELVANLLLRRLRDEGLLRID